MFKAALSLAIISLLAACAGGGRDMPRDRLDRVLASAPGKAQPTTVIALDMALSRLALEKGTSRALKETSAENAVVFVPRPTPAKDWLASGSSLPATSWEPHSVKLSCDGRLGVTTGAIRRGEAAGYYTTIWQNFAKPNRDSDWRWILTHTDKLEVARTAPDFLQTAIATCSDLPIARNAEPRSASAQTGFSQDGSLKYTWTHRADGSRNIVVSLWNGQGYDIVLNDEVAGGQ